MVNSPHGAHIHTPAAAHAVDPIDVHLPGGGIQLGAVVGADIGTGAAGHALLLIHRGAAIAVHIPLALVGAAAHAQILNGPAEAGLLMALEMVQGNNNVRIHNGPANHGVLHIFAAPHRHGHLVGALQAIGNDYVAAGGIGGEAIEIGRLQMVQGVFPGAHIHGIGIRQEGLAPQILD